MEGLFRKLKELGYTGMFAEDGNTLAHHIIEYYKLHDKLNGCILVYEKDRKELDNWYGSDKLRTEVWNGFGEGLQFSGSGC